MQDPKSKNDVINYYSKDINQLADLLDVDNQKPNVMTSATFARFAPLFKTSASLESPDMENLGSEYLSLVDPYRETVVVDKADTGKVILTLPPIFMPVKPIPNTPEMDQLVMINTNMALTAPQHHADKAMNNMTHAVVKAQLSNTDAIAQARGRYKQIMDQFNGKATSTTAPAKSPAEPTDIDAGDVVSGWDFD